MGTSEQRPETTARRTFLAQMSAGAAASLVGGQLAGGQDEASGDDLLPTIPLGPHRVTRLIAGANPIGGYSHTTLNMSRHMLEHFTLERTIEFLQRCEQAGIDTWQYSQREKETAAIRAVREQGSKLQVICLLAERGFDDPIGKVVAATRPIAIVHHGGVTDSLFRAGKAEKVHDFVKKCHDHGVLAGVSAHNPDNIKRIADEDWENDLFMTCFYYVTRPREEQLAQLGKAVVGEPFFESDPDDMSAVIRQTSKPCLAFKILAAGRVCWSKSKVERAFKYAFEHIKPSDGVIVGMYPRYHDEIADNCKYTRQYGVV